MNKIYLLFPIMTLMGSLGGFFFKKGAAHLDFKNVFKIGRASCRERV